MPLIYNEVRSLPNGENMEEKKTQKSLIESLLLVKEDGNKLLSNPNVRNAPIKFWALRLLGQLRRIYGEQSPMLSRVKLRQDSIDAVNKFDVLLGHIALLEKIISQLQRVEAYSISHKPKVFLGHGRDLVWSRVHTFLKDELGFDVEVFEAESRASSHIIESLSQMLEQCEAAVIVMTAEDETAEGTVRARQNVVHEIGLFQGRHGFKNVVVFQQSGVEEFTNISGLQTVRFSARPEDGFYELGRALSKILGVQLT